jgi:hypothetical protein
VEGRGRRTKDFEKKNLKCSHTKHRSMLFLNERRYEIQKLRKWERKSPKSSKKRNARKQVFNHE